MPEDLELGEEIPFEIVKEAWNTYRLKDGTTAKARYIQSSVFKKHVEKGLQIFTEYQTVVSLSNVPKRDMGKPSDRSYSSEEMEEAVVEPDITPKVMQENWNVYKLEDGTELQVKLALAGLAKTSLYNRRGQPIYLVTTQPVVKRPRKMKP
ncbi:MAG: hypothetical protein ACE5KH_06080 [Candidatus Geothermarchaeales archaeon]